jgi:AraC family transcriptional regulator
MRATTNASLTSADTHGILARPGQSIISCSDPLGWRTLFASRQIEQPYSDYFSARDDLLIVLHLSGPVTVERDFDGDRASVNVHRGGLFILPGGRNFGVSLGGSLESIHIYVRSALLRHAAQELGVDDQSLNIVPKLGVHDSVIEQLGLTCCTMLAERHSDFFAEGVARILASRIIAAHAQAALAPLPARHGLSQSQLDAVRDLVEARIEGSVTVEDLAALTGLSTFQFTRQFKRSVGLTPYQFVIDARLDRAREILMRGTTIADTAAQTGFSHQEHLTRMFRRRFGVTPGQFRKAVMQ